MNMDERDGQTLSPRLLRSDRPALGLMPAGHVSLPEAEFQALIKELADLRRFKRMRVAKEHSNPRIDDLIQKAAQIWNVSPEKMVSPRINRIYSEARFGAYAAGCRLGLDPHELIAALGRTSRTGQAIRNRSRDLLEVDPDFRRMVDSLEASCS